ncbi:DUF1127 domain-containing protein [Pelagibius sp. CAU 1746]|uniref:DUF1127 domain-containing protein n=1 Tax=Pelagibius sp. CAU 1746 TaxID=3140370 RepID=UPI00325B181C
MKQFNNIQDPIARAEAMRAQAVAEIVLEAIEGLQDLFKAGKAKLSAYLEYRRTYDILSAMTDRELDDIGIGRSDIEAVARGFDPRAQEAEASMGDALAQRLALAKAFDKAEEAAAPAANSDHRTAAAA